MVVGQGTEARRRGLRYWTPLYVVVLMVLFLIVGFYLFVAGHSQPELTIENETADAIVVTGAYGAPDRIWWHKSVPPRATTRFFVPALPAGTSEHTPSRLWIVVESSNSAPTRTHLFDNEETYLRRGSKATLTVSPSAIFSTPEG